MSDTIGAEPTESVGANAWIIDEMREVWRADPASVDDAWRTLFETEASGSPPVTAEAPAAPAGARTTIDTTATDVTAAHTAAAPNTDAAQTTAPTAPPGAAAASGDTSPPPGQRWAPRSRQASLGAGGAPVGVEFRVLAGSVVFLPAPRSRGGDAGRAQATAIVAAVEEHLGRSPGDRPMWATREPVPGLDEHEAELERAQELVRRAEEQRDAANAESEPLRRVRDVLWTEGSHALLPAARRCLELLGFASREIDDLPMLQADGVRIELEVEGSEVQVGMAPHYRLRRRLDARIEHESNAPRGLIVVNGERMQAPDRREEPYAEALRVAAEATSYALLPAPELFSAARAALAGADDDTLAAIRARIAETNGLVDLSDLLGEGAS